MWAKTTAFILMMIIIAMPAWAGIVAKPYTFTAGQTLPAASLNADFDTIYNAFNGNIDHTNLSPTAGIVMSQLNPNSALFFLMAGGNQTVKSGTTGDTQARIAFTSDGSLLAGPGGATVPDVGIFRASSSAWALRNASNTSYVDLALNNLTVNGTLTLGSQLANLVYASPNAVSGAPSFRALVTGDLPSISSGLTGILPLANGGTGVNAGSANAAYNALSPMSTLGDIEYEDGTPKAVRLAGNTTTTKKYLSQTGTGTVSAAPAWSQVSPGDLSQSGATLNQVIAWNGSVWAPTAAGVGTVTSVGMTGDGTIYNASVTGSPITSSGTLAPSLKSQAANTVFANATNASAAPTFVQGTTNGTYFGMSGGVLGFSTPPAAFQTAQTGGRCYGTSGHPFGDSATVTNVYYGPAYNNRIDLDNGSGTIVNQTFGEASIATTGFTNGVNDIYVKSTSSTTISLSSAAWTGNTPPTRGTDAAGRLTKNADTSSLLVAVVYQNSGAVVDTLQNRDFWNYYNRVPKPIKSPTFSGSTAGTTLSGVDAFNGFVVLVSGQADGNDADLVFSGTGSNGTASDGGGIAIGLDSTTVASSTVAIQGFNSSVGLAVRYSDNPGIGQHKISALFEAVTGGTYTLSGTYLSQMSGTWSY